MPLKIIPPRKGKSPNFSVRGTHRGFYVDKTSGTDKRSDALKKLRDIEQQIEDGEYGKAETPARSEPTFVNAAIRYLEDRPPSTTSNRGFRPSIQRLGEYFGEDKLLSEIDQIAIDDCAKALYPRHTAVTRNAYVYMPVSAILHHAGLDVTIRRPKGYKGKTVTNFMQPHEADAIVSAAETIDPEFALLLRILLYTGLRLSSAANITCDRIDIDQAAAFIPHTKNGDPVMVRFRDDLVDQVAAHKAGRSAGRFFRFRVGGLIYKMLSDSTLIASGLRAQPRPKKGENHSPPPHRLDWVTFHTFRHTWATWMRQYGKLDAQGLVATGNWRDVKSAMRYAHAVPRDEWDKVSALPSVGKKSA